MGYCLVNITTCWVIVKKLWARSGSSFYSMRDLYIQSTQFSIGARPVARLSHPLKSALLLKWSPCKTRLYLHKSQSVANHYFVRDARIWQCLRCNVSAVIMGTLVLS